MTRVTALSNPLLLGFEEIERLVDRATKGDIHRTILKGSPRTAIPANSCGSLWQWPGLHVKSLK